MSLNIGFLYYSFYPVTGGASVHGYNLAKELADRGHRLYKLNGKPDGHTILLPGKLTGFLKMLLVCDLIYVRMDYFLNFRNLAALLAKLLGKRVVVELNSPSDELLIQGHSMEYLKRIDWLYGHLLRRMDALITVSEPIKRYCIQELKIPMEKITVIPNGSELIDADRVHPDPETRKVVEAMASTFEKIVLWSGTVTKMQDLGFITDIAESVSDEIGMLIITNEPELMSEKLPNDFVTVLSGLDREDVKYIVTVSDAGLALYDDYSWCRWGFYNSSLKLYEYCNNGLLTVTNISDPGPYFRSFPNLHRADNPAEAVDLLLSQEPSNLDNPETGKRTWKDVARETESVMNEVVTKSRGSR